MKEFEFLFLEDENQSTRRLDSVILNHLVSQDQIASRSLIAESIKRGLVRVNEIIKDKPSFLLKNNDSVRFTVANRTTELEADSSVEFKIVYADDDILVINKPAGLVVHPGSGVRSQTLVNGILSYLDQNELSDKERPGIVHRLDKGTSGLMIVARNDEALITLQKQFLPPRSISRTYLALTSGSIKKKKGVKLSFDEVNQRWSGVIDAPIIRDQKKRTVFKVSEKFLEGRNAVSKFIIDRASEKASLFQVELETGRTHQIRVHLSYLGTPIVGDVSYGGVSHENDHEIRPLLHAWRLKFNHPRSNKLMEFEAEIPVDFKQILNKLIP